MVPGLPDLVVGVFVGGLRALLAIIGLSPAQIFNVVLNFFPGLIAGEGHFALLAATHDAVLTPVRDVARTRGRETKSGRNRIDEVRR